MTNKELKQEVKKYIRPSRWSIPLEFAYTKDRPKDPDPKKWINCYEVYGVIQYHPLTYSMIRNDEEVYYSVGIDNGGVIEWCGQYSATGRRVKYTSWDKAIDGLVKMIDRYTSMGYKVKLREGDIVEHAINFKLK